MLLVNQVVESVLAEEPFEQPARVLWVHRDLDLATFMTIPKEEEMRAPWSMPLSEAESLMNARKLRLTTVRVPPFMLRLEEDLSDKSIKVRDRCWEIVQPLVEGPEKDYLYLPGELGSLIAAHAKKTGKQRKTIYRLLYRYWALGLRYPDFFGHFRLINLSEGANT